MQYLVLIFAGRARRSVVANVSLLGFALFVAVTTAMLPTFASAAEVRITHLDGKVDVITTSSATQEISVRQGDKIEVLNATLTSATISGGNSEDYIVTLSEPSGTVEITFVGLFLLFAVGDPATSPAGADNPPTILIVGETEISHIGDALSQISTAVGGGGGRAAGGGGEAFGIIQVVSWLLNRLNPVSSAQAAELPPGSTGGLFPQMKAQLLIARETGIVNIAQIHVTAAVRLVTNIKRLAIAGHASDVDVDRVEIHLLEARLELRDARFRLALAADAHENEFGERLESRGFPMWKTAPPTELNAITEGITADQTKLARTFWRQARHARETRDLVRQLVSFAEKANRAYERQFELGQRTITELLSAQRLVFDARVQLVAREADLAIAESWILAAHGKLEPASIEHPGQQ